MKIIGSHLCPNTLYALMKCKELQIPFAFQDISASLSDLKSFLALHEHEDLYYNYREMSAQKDYIEQGKIGLPCFVFEDGYKTLSLEEAVKRSQQETIENVQK